METPEMKGRGVPEEMVEVFTPRVTRGGKVVWHPRWFSHGEVFRFLVPRTKYRGGGTPQK